MEPSWQELASSQDYERDAPGAAYRPSVDEMARRIKDATDDVKLHAELARLRAENEALREALNNCRLLAARQRTEEWATHILRFCATAGVTGSALRTTAPEPAPEPAGDVCEWQDEQECGFWDTACKRQFRFIDGDPDDNGYKHCPGCGKRVQVRK